VELLKESISNSVSDIFPLSVPIDALVPIDVFVETAISEVLAVVLAEVSLPRVKEGF
jgi:hypothetical protein